MIFRLNWEIWDGVLGLSPRFAIPGFALYNGGMPKFPDSYVQLDTAMVQAFLYEVTTQHRMTYGYTTKTELGLKLLRKPPEGCEQILLNKKPEEGGKVRIGYHESPRTVGRLALSSKGGHPMAVFLPEIAVEPREHLKPIARLLGEVATLRTDVVPDPEDPRRSGSWALSITAQSPRLEREKLGHFADVLVAGVVALVEFEKHLHLQQ